jgi:hypothetical protein
MICPVGENYMTRETRRRFLFNVVPVACSSLLLCAGFIQLPQEQTGGKKGWPSRPEPADPIGPPMAPGDPRQIPAQNRQQIQKDVEKLYALASELKEEIANTDSNNILSLTMVQRAKDIEKLAKHIASLARS